VLSFINDKLLCIPKPVRLMVDTWHIYVWVDEFQPFKVSTGKKKKKKKKERRKTEHPSRSGLTYVYWCR
jgi:hypothetical protein